MTARCALFLLALAVVCLAAPASAAGIPIDGRMIVSGWAANSDPVVFVLEGTSSTISAATWAVDLPDISPDLSRVAYDLRVSGGLFEATTGDVWVANYDGTDAVSVTGPTGLGGVNCVPVWSPDGSMIAFQHASPAVGQVTCDAGFQVWLMNVDGTDLRQWLAEPDYDTWFAAWASDGFRLLAEARYEGRVTADVNGEGVSVAPGPNGQYSQWSRDGSKLVYSMTEDDTVSGEPGVWRQLVLADPDGSNPQVLVQQFVSDSDIEAHVAKYQFEPADHNWLTDIRSMVGPHRARWSPRGNQLAFIAAMPFDPNGVEYWYQREVWLYDLETEQLTRLTSDTNWDNWLSWAGPNTTPGNANLTVDNVTVAFDQVDSDGLTTIIREDGPPALPADYVEHGPFYHVQTTAEVAGPIAISMSYDDVTGAAEGYLAMMHYNDATSQWEDVTTLRDAADNTVYGQTDSLSAAGLALRLPTGHFSDVSSLAPNPFWALWDIEACVNAGIVSGYEDGTYRPTVPVTRDQMAVYISRALAGGDSNVPAFTGTPTFPDVGETFWALKYVQYAVDQAVVTGYEDGSYHPEYEVNRAQMAVYVARAMVAPTGEAALADYVPSDPRNFPDVPSDFWAWRHIEYCVENSVVAGYEDGNYHPEIVVTRDQMAVYVARAFGL